MGAYKIMKHNSVSTSQQRLGSGNRFKIQA